MKEDQLREDQRREALARSREEPGSEETLPPRAAVPAAPRFDEPVPEPRVEAAPRMEESRQEPPQPKVDSKVLLESAGLVMVETKSHAPQPPVSEQPQQLGRPRRERPKPAAQDDELQQVETRK